MSIVETMGDAIAASVGERIIGCRLPAMVPEVMARAALRAIKPSDITEQMMREFVVTLSCGDAPKPTEEDLELFRRALAAAIAAGAEQ